MHRANPRTTSLPHAAAETVIAQEPLETLPKRLEPLHPITVGTAGNDSKLRDRIARVYPTQKRRLARESFQEADGHSFVDGRIDHDPRFRQEACLVSFVNVTAHAHVRRQVVRVPGSLPGEMRLSEEPELDVREVRGEC